MSERESGERERGGRRGWLHWTARGTNHYVCGILLAISSLVPFDTHTNKPTHTLAHTMTSSLQKERKSSNKGVFTLPLRMVDVCATTLSKLLSTVIWNYTNFWNNKKKKGGGWGIYAPPLFTLIVTTSWCLCCSQSWYRFDPNVPRVPQTLPLQSKV